jgi:outer membrane protein insertion porin family
MILCLLFIAALMLGAPQVFAVPIIRHIQVEGNVRIPAESILQQISAIPDQPFERAKLQEDLIKLYNCGLFEDVEIQSHNDGPGQVDITYHIREHPFISNFLIEGVDEGLADRIHSLLRKERLELYPGTPFNPSAGNKVARRVRDFFRNRKYPNAEVRVSTEKRGDTVRVALYIQPGQHLEVGVVRFIGNDSVPQKELLHQMQYARPAPFWARWGGAARYVPEELQSDLQRISFYYKSHGFAAATVGRPLVRTTSAQEKQRLEIEIPIVEGVRYQLTSIGIEGNAKAASTDVQELMSALQTPCEYNYSLLESTRQKIADALGHHGYALACVQLKQSMNEINRAIQAVYKLDPGDPVAVGKIVFHGNDHLQAKFLRRELRIGEGEVFDTAKLDQSVERLNKSNMLNEIHRADVSLEMNSQTGLLDITFNVKEKDHQGIYFTGGSGGMGGGYLGLLYTAFNLLRLGETLSLELDGGAAQSNMLLNIVGTRFLGSPFTLALSVFNRSMGYNVANIVPDADNLVQIFHRRSSGAGLSGAYPLTKSLQAGLSFGVEKDSITGSQSVNSVQGRSLRSELAPFVLYDRTHGSGPATRGYKISYSQALEGSLFLQSLDSMRQSAQVAFYLRDPWTHGRNSFAFRFQGSRVRPHGNNPLFLDRRFYPGDEIVRGFGPGSLSPWAVVPSDSDFQLLSAGADTVLGFSAEYRVPISGPLSSAGFFDLGWTHLETKSAAQLGAGAILLERANGMLRSSLGGELRLQLPVIHQPARLIFSWNLLRLNTLFGNSSSALRLTEPQRTLRFALGTFY